MNADLHLGDEAVDMWIDCGVYIGFNDPAAESFLLVERDRCERGGKRVITSCEGHCVAKVGAAKNGKPVHAVGRDMNGCTDTIWQLPIAREPNRISASRHQFGERN